MMNFMKISFSFTRKSGISFKKSKLYEKKWNFPWNTQNNLKIWKNIHFFYSKKFWKVFTFSIKNYNLFDTKFTFSHKKKWNSNKKKWKSYEKKWKFTHNFENFGKIHCFHKKVGTFSIENQNDFHLKKTITFVHK